MSTNRNDYPIVAKNDEELRAGIDQIQRDYGPEARVRIVPRFGASKCAEAHEIYPANQ